MVASRPPSAAVRGAGQRRPPASCALGERGVERVDGRRQRVVHRLVTRLGLASRDDAVEPGSQGGRDAAPASTGRRRRATCPCAGRTCRTAARSRRRPSTPASCRPCVNSAPAVAGSGLVQRGHGGLHPSVHVRPVVGVADRGVELGQVVPVLGDEAGEARGPTASRAAVVTLSAIVSDSPSQGRRPDRRVPERQQLVVDLAAV